MALTITRTGFYPSGGTRNLKVAAGNDIVMVVGKLTFDNSYDAGGESLTPASIGLKEILHISLSVEATTSGIIHVGYDYANQKVVACNGVAGLVQTQVTGGTDLSAWSVRFVAFGPRK